MSKERRLGRGLEALLSRVPSQPDPAADQAKGPYGPPAAPGQPAVTQPVSPRADTPPEQHDAPEAAAPTGAAAAGGTRRVEVRQIDRNPFQPRQDFDEAEIRSLADSLATHGLLQPVVLRRIDDRYQLIAGERRLRAAVQAGWTDVPANIIQADDRETAELTIVENLQRKDLNPLEKAASFQQYLERYGSTQEELASRLNLDRSTIANLIRLLELPDPVQDAIRRAKITQGHARALLPLGEQREQIALCERIQREGLNVRQTESLVQETINTADRKLLGLVGRDGRTSRAGRVQSDHLAALEQEFRAALGVKVKITHNARGRGKLVIHFRSHEEFERLRHQITDTGRPGAKTQAG